jgi:hypothetical protein
MVDITIVFVGIIMVYKPTNITGGAQFPGYQNYSMGISGS